MTNLERAIKDGYAHIIGEKGKQKITYVSSDNHVENYSDPEEKVRTEFWAELIYKYEYPVNRIKIEVTVPDRLPTDRADIVVFRDDECKRPYAVVECKKDGVTDAEFNQAIEQGVGNATWVKLRADYGNHRLSAAASVGEDFAVPFCLLLFQNPEENGQYSRAIFHNINAKQVPLNLEENLKVILESDGVFSDEKLKTDPSFGWPYYLARKISQQENFEEYPFINLLIRGIKYTYLLQVCQLLIENQTLPKTDEAVNSFREQLPQIEAALQEARLHVIPNNLAVIGAISFYKLTNVTKYQHFLSWAKENSITRAPGLHMNDLIQIFDQIYENMPKSIFVSMQFSVETEDTYQTIKDVRDILKRENGLQIKLIKVDEHHDGYSDEIYHRIIDGIKESSLVIADLSFGNKNVHHEIGYAQGLAKKVLLLYKTRDGVPANSEIGSNISMHDQVRFRNQAELRPILLRKIREFFGIEVDD